MKIRPVEAESFHADDLMDMTKLTVVLRMFANAPEKCEVQEYCNMCHMENEIVGLWLVNLYYTTRRIKLDICWLILLQDCW